jgi:hypothetical protein
MNIGSGDNKIGVKGIQWLARANWSNLENLDLCKLVIPIIIQKEK